MSSELLMTPNASRERQTGDRTFVLISGDFVQTGGMDRANHALAKFLACRGDNVHLVSYRLADDLQAFENLEFHRVGKLANSYLLSHPLLSQAGSRIARQITRESPSARVIVNGGNCRWGDVNWLHHLNVLDRPPTMGLNLRGLHRRLAYRLYEHEDRASLRKARLIVTTCERNKRDLLNWIDVPSERVQVVYYGADPELFYPGDAAERLSTREQRSLPIDRPLFAFVGGLSDRRKGFDVLFAAWCQLARFSSWDADLVVIGSGSELESWKDRARSETVDNRIHFLGFRRDVPEILRACDAHILPSRYEGYSLATQEALISGLPAMVTKTAGIAERYPEPLAQRLLIDDPNDVSELIGRLKILRAELADEFLVQALWEFARTLRSWSWSDMAAEFARRVETIS